MSSLVGGSGVTGHTARGGGPVYPQETKSEGRYGQAKLRGQGGRQDGPGRARATLGDQKECPLSRSSAAYVDVRDVPQLLKVGSRISIYDYHVSELPDLQ
jgi:hypothetical protein